MSALEVIGGWARLVVWIAAAGVGARTLRRWVLPTVAGPLAALAEVTIGLSTSVIVMELCGTVGLFTRWNVLAAVVIANAAIVALARRYAPAPTDPAPVTDDGVAWREAHTLTDRLPFVVTGLIAVGFAVATVVAGRHGVVDNDTMRYHGPFVARWVQLHDLTHLHHTSRELQEVFFPANSELVAAGGVLTFGTDWLTPLLNLGWFAIALLAAWCVPLDPRRRPLAMMAVAAVVAAPRLMGTQPGSGRNDLAAAALVLAFVALAHRLGDRRWGLAVAGAALGLAVGTKLSVAVLAAVLVVALAVLHRGHRIATAAIVTGTAIVTGGFWYARNWARAGNPLPWYHLDLGPLHLESPRFLGVEEHGQRIVDRVSQGGFWTTTVPEGLRYAIGSLWIPVLVIAVVIVAIGSARRGWPRALAITIAVAFAAHTVTPFSAGGGAVDSMFGPQLRFLAAPALLTAVLIALLVPLRHRAWFVWGTTVYVASAVAAVSHSLLGLAAFALALGVALVPRGSVPVGARRPIRIALGIVLAIAALAAAPLAARLRYDDPGRDPSWAVYSRFRDVRGARIAVGSMRHTYPLAGPDLSNEVQLLGTTEPHGGFEPVRTRDEWVDAIRAGHYDYVVVGRSHSWGGPELVQGRWTESMPGAVEIFHEGTNQIFRIHRGSSDGKGLARAESQQPA